MRCAAAAVVGLVGRRRASPPSVRLQTSQRTPPHENFSSHHIPSVMVNPSCTTGPQPRLILSATAHLNLSNASSLLQQRHATSGMPPSSWSAAPGLTPMPSPSYSSATGPRQCLLSCSTSLGPHQRLVPPVTAQRHLATTHLPSSSTSGFLRHLSSATVLHNYLYSIVVLPFYCTLLNFLISRVKKSYKIKSTRIP